VEREIPNLVGDSDCTKSTEFGDTFEPLSRDSDVDLIVDLLCRSDPESERLGCDDESESVSDIFTTIIVILLCKNL